MSLNLYRLAKALKVSTEISDEDMKVASDIFERNKMLESINVAYDILVAERVLKRIEELVEKVEKL